MRKHPVPLRPPRYLKLQPTGRFQNAPKSYEHIRVEPLAAAMGARVETVGKRPLAAVPEAGFDEISDALARHKMLFFGGVGLTHAEHEALTLKFGAFGTDAYATGVSETHPNVQLVRVAADSDAAMVFGEGWHTDSPFLERPPSVSILRSGDELPPFGGDTYFANTELAYDHLSATMQKILEPLRVHMSAAAVLDTMTALAEIREDGEAKLGDVAMDHLKEERTENVKRRAMRDGWYHPIVRTHPLTGRRALYIDETYSHGIQGLTPDESMPILGMLQAHVTQLAFTCRLKWEPHSVAIWDNRSCIHRAFNDYAGFGRTMFRTTVQGEVPV